MKLFQSQKTVCSIRSATLCALFAALIIAGTFIRIPFVPMPFTLQVLFVTLAGLLLGPKKGLIACATYLFLGLIGLPIFSQGSGGIGYALTPSFGFAVGFLPGAFVTGLALGDQKSPTFLRALLSGLAGVGVIYSFGVIYAYLILNLYLGEEKTAWYVLFNYCILFLPADLLKCVVCAFLTRRLKPILSKIQPGTRE